MTPRSRTAARRSISAAHRSGEAELGLQDPVEVRGPEGDEAGRRVGDAVQTTASPACEQSPTLRPSTESVAGRWPEHLEADLERRARAPASGRRACGATPA